jgi:predicted RNA-binding Zn-ribbon protein involved in translation (DUF1610 family)
MMVSKTFYQFECEDCGAVFFIDWKPGYETSQPFCPNCGQDHATKNTGFIVDDKAVEEDE